MSNRLVDGWAFRVLTVVDQFSREWPKAITVDNGSEFYSWAMDAWV